MTTQRSGEITINSDMGEAFGLHTFGNDADLMPIIDIANIACGFHSGDPQALEETVKLAAAHGTGAGAHPGLPDLVGFGRREMKLFPEEVENLIRYQVGALKGFLDKYDLPLNHIKPHGSLYGMLARDEELMRAAAQVAKTYNVPMLGLAGTAHQRVCEAEGIEFISELYVDLNYTPEGNLIIVRKPHETDPQAAYERTVKAVTEGKIFAEDGTEIAMEFGSICVHSDTKSSTPVAAAVRKALTELGK